MLFAFFTVWTFALMVQKPSVKLLALSTDQGIAPNGTSSLWILPYHLFTGKKLKQKNLNALPPEKETRDLLPHFHYLSHYMVITTTTIRTKG